MTRQRLPKQTRADETRARAIVARRDAGRCVRCRRFAHGLNFDHRVNRSQGGRWSASNGQMLCGSGTTGCHGWATTHPELAIADGWSVPGWGDPQTWPSRRWVHDELVWVLLDDSGGFTRITDEDARNRMDGRGWAY